MMPVLNGFETTAVIRNHSSAVRNHAVPVIALTARAFKEDRDICREAGMNDYLSKPIFVPDLLGMLERWAPIYSTQGAALQGSTDGGTIEPSLTSGIFDLAEFVLRNQGDINLSRDIAAIFIDSASEYIELIRKAVAALDAVALRQSAHKLKGAAANLSLSALSDIASMIESFAEIGDLEKAAEMLPELEQRAEESVQELKDVLIDPQGVSSQ
jgi:CheY-like chemotaxis protein